MALKFRLKGLAETFIDEIRCPGCGFTGRDDQNFTTDLTRVTLEGIVVVAECRRCGEIFVPDTQRCGILNARELRVAVENDARETGEPLFRGIEAVRLSAERLNAQRRGDLH
ncbi:MAG: hypothetical protein D6719_04935 [Candidatus Dadabacteria bacterium]|nr:MAG: hypothetical protein D6719_04935 [Candidatus Dadabacteria bacterium]